MNRALLATLLTGGICLALGYYLGKASHDPDTVSTPRLSYGRATAPSFPTSHGTPASVPASASARDSLAGLSNAEVKERTLQALREPDRILRWKAWMDILAGVNEQNVWAVSEGLMERYDSGGNTGEEGELLQFREGQILGAASKLNLPAEPNGHVEYHSLNKIRGWASADPAAAKAWIEALEPGSVQNTLRAKWLEGLSRAAPEQIAEVFDSLPAGQQRSLVSGLLGGIHDKGGFPAVTEWFDGYAGKADPAVMSRAFQDIMGRMTQNAEQWNAAAEWMKAKAGENYVTPAGFEAFSSHVASADPGRCLDLLQDLSGKSPAWSEQMDSLIQQTVERSAANTLNKLGNWLDSHRDHPLYDQTVKQFAIRTKTDDLESALRWAETIKDETLRARTRASLEAN